MAAFSKSSNTHHRRKKNRHGLLLEGWLELGVVPEERSISAGFGVDVSIDIDRVYFLVQKVAKSGWWWWWWRGSMNPQDASSSS